MIKITGCDGEEDTVGQHNLISLSAAIEAGNRDAAFHELSVLLMRDADCAHWVDLGRQRARKSMAVAA